MDNVRTCVPGWLAGWRISSLRDLTWLVLRLASENGVNYGLRLDPPFVPPSSMPLTAMSDKDSLASKTCTLAILVLLISLGDLSYTFSDDSAESSGIEFFEKSIRPLLAEHCYECHAGGETKGGLRLDSSSGWLAGGESGQALIPSKPDASRLIDAVRYANRDLQMPPVGRISAAEIELLERWVLMGAPAPQARFEPEGIRSPSGMSVDDGRKFWSLLPVANPSLPVLNDTDWVQSPIDAYVLSGLESVGLRPAPQADRRTLIRRVTYDLIGLPPTPDEVDAFLTDNAPEAMERLVDRLLASPRYGERWGRHWLDVVRYADSNGLDENLAFGNAWRFRDYVISAMNSDKAFDRFLVEQIAGDLVDQPTEATKTATGFLVLGAKVLAEPDREKLAMDTVDEQIDTTGKAFLGMTLGCVRCHNHKFDPILQTDYYALAAIFKSTRTFADSNTGAIKHWNEHSFASQEDRQRLKEVDAAIAAKNSAATKFKNEALTQVRKKAVADAAKYLAAASLFSTTHTLKDVEAIAQVHGLHARILHHCRLHLEYNQQDLISKQWHERVNSGLDFSAIENYFQSMFTEALQDKHTTAKESSDAPTQAEPSTQDETSVAAKSAQRDLVVQALNDPSGFLTVPPQAEYALDAEEFAEYDRLAEEARVLESQAPDEPAVMGVEDGTVLVSLPIHIRGSHRSLGEPVAREFPEVMRTSTVRPVLPRNQSGRLELAQWMASSQHPLTARVYVNRVWRWHFGRGIVGTTENFGLLGDRPTHPELLDWLARHFMESGWSTKELHRLILLSSTYQMASIHGQTAGQDIDPENNLLWSFRQQRLEAEQLRDSILAVSGRLDLASGGKSVPLRNRQFVFNHTSKDHTTYDSLRRAVYLPVIRNNLYTLFEQFDFPDPTMPTGDRKTTTVAPQALLMMNDSLVMDSAADFAARICRSFSQAEQRVDFAYQLAFSRRASDREMSRGLEFVSGVSKQMAMEQAAVQENSAAVSHQSSPDVPTEYELSAWSLFCQSLMASNEFLYLE